MYINSSVVRLTLKLKHWGYWQSLVRIFSSFSPFDCASKCKIPDNWAYLELVKQYNELQTVGHLFFQILTICPILDMYILYFYKHWPRKSRFNWSHNFQYLVEKVCFFKKISKYISSRSMGHICKWKQLKFIYSEKATKFCEISTNYLTSSTCFVCF